jgi:ribonuclease BN (tRNA processing enzyme)
MRLAQEVADWHELDAVWISHFHMDHCGGLGPLLAGTKHTPALRSRTKPLVIYGPVGIHGLLTAISDVHNYRLLEQSFPVEVVEVEALDGFEIVAGAEAVTAESPHTPESQAIHLRDSDGKTLVYSADTGFSEPIAAFAGGSDLFILECTFFRDKPVEKHLELAEAMFMIRKARPKRAMLTHFYPEWDAVDMAAEIRRYEPPCEVLEAVDGLRIDI